MLFPEFFIEFPKLRILNVFFKNYCYLPVQKFYIHVFLLYLLCNSCQDCRVYCPNH